MTDEKTLDKSTGEAEAGYFASRDFIDKLNAAYSRLERRRDELARALARGAFALESGWYNGHWFRRGADGQWQRDAYPIPVISVKGLCDIEIPPDRLSLSAKLRRQDALEYSYDGLRGYAFEAYGVEDYLNDLYREGRTIQELKDAVANSGESEIGFSFSFPFVADAELIAEFAGLLRREGFYY